MSEFILKSGFISIHGRNYKIILTNYRVIYMPIEIRKSKAVHEIVHSNHDTLL